MCTRSMTTPDAAVINRLVRRSGRYVVSHCQCLNMSLARIISLIVLFLLGIFCVVAFGYPTSSETSQSTCGYESCPVAKPNVLNVHIIPHSHDDVGWLKTVDQYYWGTKSNIQLAGVQFILDSVVRELLDDPKKKFIYVETAFFWKWWLKQDDMIKKQVKMLVNEGRLEFIGGAWSMNDEAVVHYTSTIDQFTWGLRKLNETFGKCGRPKVGWQIDPFGHSREQASLFSQMGYDGFMFGRLDYQDKARRLEAQEMEMIWKGSDSLNGYDGSIFTHALYNTYSAPSGFCFDVLCGESPLVDDEESPEYNIQNKVETFISYVKNQSSHYTSNNVIVTMGDDFNYQSAAHNFKNLDMLIKYVNKKQDGVFTFYSTPSCYLKAVNSHNLNYKVKHDDFFPYCSDPNACWTGYFTSRPTIKYFERLGYQYSQVAKQLDSLSHSNADLSSMKEAVGIMQHHDAITGTEKQHVAQDYARILYAAIDKTHNYTEEALKALVIQENNGHADSIQFLSCLRLNMSECETTEKAPTFVVTVYNPLSHPVDYNVRVPVQEVYKFTVQNQSGSTVEAQVVPIHAAIFRNPDRRSNARNELVFKASQVPPLGFESYFVTGVPSDVTINPQPEEYATFAGFNNFGINLDQDGRVKSVFAQGRESTFTQDFAYYIGAAGDNKKFERRSSGAYIFRNNGSAVDVKLNSSKVYNGNLVSEIHQTFSEDWINQVFRVYKDTEEVEVEWIVGPIPIDDNNGKEVITKYTMEHIDSQNVFYTDSNGREMLERRQNYRPTWNYEVNEPVSGNYYPVTTRMSLKGKANISVIVDRAQGGTSLQDGQIELMVHRRLLHDDAFGVGEALNETSHEEGLIVIGRHVVLINKKTRDESLLQLRKFNAPWLFFTPAQNFTHREWARYCRMKYSGLTRSLPSNVHILTLEAWQHNTVLLRLEHIMERSNNDDSTKNVLVNIQDLFLTFKVLSAQETYLAANIWTSEYEKLRWKSDQVEEVIENAVLGERLNISAIELSPMQIRTFVLKVSYYK